MSIAIMSQLFRAHLGSTNRKMLAVRLADFADDDGKGIWPTVGRLAQETELSQRSVQRILAEFVEEGCSSSSGRAAAGPEKLLATISTWLRWHG
ncbi:helix-turn-helix domain-containing protein [Sinorhizobium meliloti]|nr:helix-turn-helix domain-containing protein [Sinorhizobium meliloti]